MTLTRTVVPVLLATALAMAPAAPASARPLGAGPRKGPLVVLADLLTKLQLTPAQKTQIFAVLGRHKNEIAALGAAKVEAEAQLQDAIQAARPEPAAIRRTAAQVAEVDLKISRLRARIHPQLLRILTPRQRVEVLAAMAQAKGWMGLDEAAGPAPGPRRGLRGRALGAWGQGRAGGAHLMRLLRWAGDELELTPAQREQIRTTVAARAPQLRALHKAAAGARRALRAAVRQATPDDRAIRQAAAEAARARLDFALERAQIHARVLHVLTPAQRTRLEALRSERQGARLQRAHAILTLVRELL
jgi:Spy/CpxP family protein refolding chaperone